MSGEQPAEGTGDPYVAVAHHEGQTGGAQLGPPAAEVAQNHNQLHCGQMVDWHMKQTGGAQLGGELQIAVLQPLQDHEEGHVESVNIEQSAEDNGDLQAAVLHLLHDHHEGHAERVNVEQSA